jgi:hydroxymethylpyrimidine/phosphomethylpyrimidine kinase
MKTVLTIAGSDCSGGAGIQADIKTITVHKLYAMSVITALTAQNTTGVSRVCEVSPNFVAEQLDMVFTDIRPDAVKIGMVSNRHTIEVIADKLIQYHAEKIVLDPVMIATSGSRLMEEDAVELLTNRLIPLADVITPNIPEAEALSGVPVSSKDEMLQAAKRIGEQYHGAILIKGGHLTGSSDDLLYEQRGMRWYESPHIDNPNSHGTGCTLSSAIACNLAIGIDIRESISLAKKFLTGALKAGLNLGKGNGPLNHCYTDYPFN